MFIIAVRLEFSWKFENEYQKLYGCPDSNLSHTLVKASKWMEKVLKKVEKSKLELFNKNLEWLEWFGNWFSRSDENDFIVRKMERREEKKGGRKERWEKRKEREKKIADLSDMNFWRWSRAPSIKLYEDLPIFWV
jgi:hypothetical protein